MKVPKGSQIGTKLLLRNKGIPVLHATGSQKGNHIVHLNIEIPKKINERQEQLLREFDEESRSSGLGNISGRIAKAAGSAFESLFGKSCSKKEEEEKKKDEKLNEEEKSKKTNDTVEEKTA